MIVIVSNQFMNENIISFYIKVILESYEKENKN